MNVLDVPPADPIFNSLVGESVILNVVRRPILESTSVLGTFTTQSPVTHGFANAIGKSQTGNDIVLDSLQEGSKVINDVINVVDNVGSSVVVHDAGVGTGRMRNFGNVDLVALAKTSTVVRQMGNGRQKRLTGTMLLHSALEALAGSVHEATDAYFQGTFCLVGRHCQEKKQVQQTTIKEVDGKNSQSEDYDKRTEK